MFGDEILNGKQLIERLGISHSFLYRLLRAGLPSHRLDGSSRRYYIYAEVRQWLFQH